MNPCLNDALYNSNTDLWDSGTLYSIYIFLCQDIIQNWFGAFSNMLSIHFHNAL